MNRFNDFKEVTLLSKAVILLFSLVLLLAVTTIVLYNNPGLFNSVTKGPSERNEIDLTLWKAPELSSISDNEEGKLIQYGHDLIARTSNFIGPLGTVSLKANGMNCQNCHLEAGTKPFGNNFGSVASMYPKFRNRSGAVESIEKRVNDCFERSLNGDAIDSLSKEMRAIVAYIKWVGKDVKRGELAEGSGLFKMKWLDRAADKKVGRKLYLQQCQVCHGNTGEGQRLKEKGNYYYPPLSGDHSFTTAAGLFRISNFSRYIYANMPHGITFKKPILSEEESWDIAAYVLSLPRPKKEFPNDWPKLKMKPVDHPFGPYADTFTEEQHKYGPFEPIEQFYKAEKK
ncbi:MAG TPA: c-type cytochrome [Cyclobacteriaceae bacterium]